MKVCFIDFDAYPMLSSVDSTYVIGSNIHNVLLAKELLKHGFKICFITCGNENKSIEYINGIEIIKVYSQKESYHLSYLSKISAIWKAMKTARADIYYQQEGAAIITSIFCKIHRKKLVICIGSDAWVSSLSDWINHKFNGFALFNRLSYELDIRMANEVIVMNEYQNKQMKRNFRKEGSVIRHHIPMANSEPPHKNEHPTIIWVGTVTRIKQPELFLKLAESLPQARFQLIGGYFPAEKEFYEKLRQISKNIPNCELVGFVPFKDINKYYERAAILVNTSKVEAYPPFAFIQAWMNYSPVVSLNDNAEEILTRNNLGFHSGCFERLITDVNSLIDNPELRTQMGENGRGYVELYYNPASIIKKYVELFKGQLKK